MIYIIDDGENRHLFIDKTEIARVIGDETDNQVTRRGVEDLAKSLALALVEEVRYVAVPEEEATSEGFDFEDWLGNFFLPVHHHFPGERCWRFKPPGSAHWFSPTIPCSRAQMLETLSNILSIDLMEVPAVTELEPICREEVGLG